MTQQHGGRRTGRTQAVCEAVEQARAEGKEVQVASPHDPPRDLKGDPRKLRFVVDWYRYLLGEIELDEVSAPPEARAAARKATR